LEISIILTGNFIEISQIFRRVWPGNFRYIRKNFHTGVIFLEPAKSLEMFSYLNSLISQNIPLRYGIVFKASEELDRIVTTMFHYVSEHSNVRDAVATLGGVSFILFLFAWLLWFSQNIIFVENIIISTFINDKN
jgi:hypothetical protein